MNGEKRITKWSVDTTDPRKILTLETGNMTAEEVKNLLALAGFKGEVVE